LIVNTTEGSKAVADSFTMRREALQRKVTYYTTMAGARAACYALGELSAGDVNCLQDLHKTFKD
jgi:carbamoyl-phosphate synthase large subunit